MWLYFRKAIIRLYSFVNLGARCGCVFNAIPGRFTPREIEPVPLVEEDG
jgi:hypothetical protein